MVTAASHDFIPAFSEWVHPHSPSLATELSAYALQKHVQRNQYGNAKFAWTSFRFANDPSSQRVQIH